MVHNTLPYLRSSALASPSCPHPQHTLHTITQVKEDLDERARAWKDDLREEIRELFKDAAVKSNIEMEQAFGPYVDAVSVEASKWASVIRVVCVVCVSV